MPGDRFTGGLLALALALGGLVWWQDRYGMALPEPPPAPPLVPSDAVHGGAAVTPPLPPLAALTDTVDRPLFSPERQPPEVAAAPVPQTPDTAPVPQAPPPSLTLSAVIIERDRRQALLVPAAGGATRRVLEGDEVEGWTLSEVREQGVVLVRGAERHELSLRTFEPPGRVAPPRGTARKPGRTRTEPAGAPRAAIPVPRPRRPLRGPRRRSLDRD